ncbi:MAG: hypothetical protein ACE361_17990 [Aureliella sp.]
MNRRDSDNTTGFVNHLHGRRSGTRLVPRQSRYSRAGFGLTHTVMLMVILGILMGLAATLLGQSYVTYRQTLNHFQRFQVLQLAHSQFRGDAHRALDVELTDQTLIMTLANSDRVEYATDKGDLVRRSFRDGKQLGEQRWALPAPASATWKLDRSGTIGLVDVLIQFDNILDESEASEERLEGPNASVDSSTYGLGRMKIEPVRWYARLGVFAERSEMQSVAGNGEEGSP